MGLQEMLFYKLLAKDPNARYQTMKDVQGAIAAFHGLTRSMPSSSHPPFPGGPPHSAILTPIPGAVSKQPTAAVADAVPMPAKRSGAPIALLITSLLLAGAGVALMFVPPDTSTTTTTSQSTIDDDAKLVAASFEAVANANQLRAESLASAPVIRAAIETDRATFGDMVKTGDFVFEPKPGEVLEVFQKRDSMMRIPEAAVGYGPAQGIRYAASGGRVMAIAGVPIKAQVEGLVVMAAPVDLASAKQRIGEHTLGAAIVGLDERITLVGANRPGTAASAPIKVAGDKPMSLEVVIPTPTTSSADRFATARLALWGTAGAAFLIFFILLLRRRGH